MEPFELVDRALMANKPQSTLEELQTAGVFQQAYPEIQAMVGFGGGESGHKDLWDHTKRVVSQTIERRAVRWAALFHDVGKVPTFSRNSGKVTFHGHEVVSARLFDKAARRVDMPADLRKHIRFLVRHLGHVEAYASEWTDSAVRRVQRDMGEYFDDLVWLASADITTRHAHKREQHKQRIAELRERAAAIAKKDAELPLLPKGLGEAIIEAFALKPGPRIGQLRFLAEAAVKEGKLPPREDAQVYIEYLKEHADDA